MSTQDAGALISGDIDPDAIANWLQQTGNYRVLKRVVKRECFDAEVQQGLKVLLVDTETTGLNIEQADVIEVGALLLEVCAETGRIGRVLAEYGELEDPGYEIPAESTDIHGISTEMVKGKCFNEDAFHQICEGVDLFVAHNAGFDKPFIERRFPWLEDSVWACSFQELPLVQEGYGSRKLENLLTECGFFHDAHRAVEDCNALAHFLATPLKTSQQMPMQVLLQSANESIYEISALHAPFEKKDAMKAKGFRWNNEDRIWEFVAIGFGQGKEIIEWLREHVYSTTDKIKLGFRVRSGADRYSRQVIKQQFKDV